MKKLALILTMALSVQLSFAQESDNKMTRKEKRKAEIQAQYEQTKQMLENKTFVLESDFLQDRYGNRAWVSPTINFVMVEGDTAVMQIGSNWGFGPNGLGGVTAKGRITKWELKENEKKNTFNLAMNVMTGIGIYEVHFSIGPSGNSRARMTGLYPGELNFDGDLVALEESSVFEGTSY